MAAGWSRNVFGENDVLNNIYQDSDSENDIFERAESSERKRVSTI